MIESGYVAALDHTWPGVSLVSAVCCSGGKTHARSDRRAHASAHGRRVVSGPLKSAGHVSVPQRDDNCKKCKRRIPHRAWAKMGVLASRSHEVPSTLGTS